MFPTSLSPSLLPTLKINKLNILKKKGNQTHPVGTVWGYPWSRGCHSTLWLPSSRVDCLPLLSSVLNILLDAQILRWRAHGGCPGRLPILSSWTLRQASGAPPGCNPCRRDQEEILFYRAANILKALREKPKLQFLNQVVLELDVLDLECLYWANLNNFNQQTRCAKLHITHYYKGENRCGLNLNSGKDGDPQSLKISH